ncbi:MAG TPA: transposase [Streptosporangiaceae bacterium]|nr:transposase [Streptosporangiaceae bacterium]
MNTPGQPAGDPPPGQLPGSGPAAVPPPGPDGLADACGRARVLVSRTRERHAAVHELLAAGHSCASAARALGLGRATVRRFAREPDVNALLVKATIRESRLDPFKPWITQRLEEGITDAARLHAELQARGWAGSAATVRRYVRQFRTPGSRAITGAIPRAAAIPKTRQITRWLLTRPDRLGPGDQARLAAVTATCPHLDDLAARIRAFAAMMTRRQGLLALEDWLTAAEASDHPQLRSFASGIRRDQHAVTAGLALPYNSGAMEGNVSKIKMIKRQMYGRAGFALLRKRVILHPALPASQSRPGARCRDCSRPVSPDLSPNPPCASQRNGLSAVPAVRLVQLPMGWGSGCRDSGTG